MRQLSPIADCYAGQVDDGLRLRASKALLLQMLAGAVLSVASTATSAHTVRAGSRLKVVRSTYVGEEPRARRPMSEAEAAPPVAGQSSAVEPAQGARRVC